MGSDTAPALSRFTLESEALLKDFARCLHERYRARVFLFGSRAKGTAHRESDYDVIAVSPAFDGQRRYDRAPNRYALWREAGGSGIGLDLHCFTPEELREELAGLGFVGQAKRRGELIEVTPSRAVRSA